MKSTSLLLLATAAALTACNEGSYEAHQTYFTPQQPDGMMLYADQSEDSTHVYSLDSWTLSLEGDGWFNVTPTQQEIPAGYTGFTKLTLRTTPNTTGENRSGAIVVNSYHTITQRVYQCTWLNILYPYAQYYYPEGKEEVYANRQAKFQLNLPFDATSSQVRLVTYADQATITSDAAWVKPEQDVCETAGLHTVALTVQPNPEETKRYATLTVTSAHITTTIQVEQQGAKPQSAS